MNKMLKFPWMKKGRWYKLFIESDGVDYKDTKVDIDIDISGNYAKFPEGFHIMDTKYDVHFTPVQAANVSFLLRTYADGRQGIVLPSKTDFDYMTIYVFGYYE